MIYEDIGWIFLEWRRFHQRRLNRFGITIQQYSLMKKIQKETPLCTQAAAKHLHCDRPTLSVVVSNLVKRGWVVREVDPGDRRKCSIRLTEEGSALLKHIDDALPQVTDKPFDVLTPEQKKALAQYLAMGRQHLAEMLADEAEEADVSADESFD